MKSKTETWGLVELCKNYYNYVNTIGRFIRGRAEDFRL